MFVTGSRKFTDIVNWRDELHRFDGDEYAAKYLAGVYNPEFRVHIANLKTAPEFSSTGICLSWGERRFDRAEEVC